MELNRKQEQLTVRNQKQKEFLKHYGPMHDNFCKYCRAISGNRDDADDLIQDTVLNVFESFEKINDLSLFKSYLFKVAGNLYKKKLRRNKFKASFNEEEIKQIVDLGQNQEHYTEFNLVYEKILSLPTRTSDTLILYYISDLSVEEIQKIQGGSIPGVKSRLQRGREKVLSLLNTKEQVNITMMLLTI